jgi:hypothetical protein
MERPKKRLVYVPGPVVSQWEEELWRCVAEHSTAQRALE